MKIRFFALTLALFATQAFAANDPCSLSGETILTEPTTIACMSNLTVADGTHIITNGYPLQILAVGIANLANLKITSYLPGTQPGLPSSEIYIYARTATGKPMIQNDGPVKLEFASVMNYEQEITVTDYAQVSLTLNGYDLNLSAPKYQLQNAVVRQ